MRYTLANMNAEASLYTEPGDYYRSEKSQYADDSVSPQSPGCVAVGAFVGVFHPLAGALVALGCELVEGGYLD